MAPTRWGILSAGKISHDFCVGVSTLNPQEHQLVAVGARNLESAKSFAKTHNIQNAYGSYEELVKDPNVEVVYIGTINPHHLASAKLALDNGKHVLCEKPLCINVKETKELQAYAKAKNLFLMEAIWSRFFPAYKRLKEELDKGTIGDVFQVIVSFGFEIAEVDRVKLKELGGGTVLDLGVYCTQFAALVFGERPERIIAGGCLNEEGVDSSTSSTLIFSGGRTATLVTSAKVQLPNEAFAVGTKGIIKLPSPMWCPTTLVLPNETLEFPLPATDKKMNFGNSQGLSYQCHEVRKCLLNGLTESSVVSHDETLRIAEIMEAIRKQVGVVYPQD
jgi:dihydrodiol dehydrogenase / D-xylose 1-dehydrogenase (NADP)